MIYLFTYELHGRFYGGRLAATSEEKAIHIIEFFLGAQYDGLLVGEYEW